jgi:protein TonB
MKNFPILLLCLLAAMLSAQQPKKKGKYTEKYDNGHVKVKGRFKNYKREGTWVWYGKWSKDTIGAVTYSAGVPDGRYYSYSGGIECRGNYRNGNKTGIWNYRCLPQSDSTCVYTSTDSNTFEYTVVSRKGRTFTQKGKVIGGMREGLYEASAGNFEKTGREEKTLEGNYINNHKNGLWLQYGKNGKLQRQIMYSYDTLKSSRRFIYSDTVLLSESDSILTEWPRKYKTRKTTFYYNGHKKREEIFNGWKRDSVWTNWYESGKIQNVRTFVNGEPDGKEEEWFSNGTKRLEANYINGKRNGLYVWRNTDGSLRDSGIYVERKKDGPWIETEGYRNKEKMVYCNYKDGKRNGKFTGYFTHTSSGESAPEKSRRKQEEGFYKNGRLNGKYSAWYITGKKKEESNYVDGELRGRCTLYDERGKVISSRVYQEQELPPVQGAITQVGDKAAEGPDVVIPQEASVEGRDYYDEFSVDQPAEFPGGMLELYKFLQTKIQYPQIEKEAGIQGTVYIRFLINTDGKIERLEVMKGISGGKALEREAMRVMKTMPDWKPALLKGKAVRQRFMLPVKFQLN